jgi:hypothetical protein
MEYWFEVRNVKAGEDRDQNPYTELVLRTAQNCVQEFSNYKFGKKVLYIKIIERK